LLYSQLVTAVLKKIDEYSTKGNILAESKTIDLRYKIPEATNEVLLDLAHTTGKLEASFAIVHNPVSNALNQDTSSIQANVPGADYSISLPSAKACYFECTGPATVYVEEETADNIWTILETIDILSSQKTFAEYRRLITASVSTNTIRLRFSGDYHYSYRNYVLYDVPFPTEDEVQQHGNYFMYAMPSDFMALKNCQIRKDIRQWQDFREYALDATAKEIGFDAYQVGEYRANYYRMPTLIGTTTPVLSAEIDALDEALPFIATGVASRVLLLDDMTISTILWNQYEIAKGNMLGVQNIAPRKHKSLSGW